MLTKKFNEIVKAIRDGEQEKADKLIMENIDKMTDKQCKKITKEARKIYNGKKK